VLLIIIEGLKFAIEEKELSAPLKSKRSWIAARCKTEE
jgi:hypothetical protein